MPLLTISINSRCIVFSLQSFITLEKSFMASSNVPGDKSSTIQSLFSSALETISLLNVARISNLIGEMNHSILVREIDNIVAMLRDRLAESAENAGYVLSESFFKTPDMFATGFRMGDRMTNTQSQNVYNRQNPNYKKQNFHIGHYFVITFFKCKFFN